MAFNKRSYYGNSLNILESEVGLVRKTRQGTQDMAQEIDGRKVITAGTLFDGAANAYVAVSNPKADSYAEVTPEDGDNPSAKGWYTKSGETYTAATDTTAQSGTTYYAKTAGDSPKAKGWYEKTGSTYAASTDTAVSASKTYYEKTTDDEACGVVFQDYDMTEYPDGYPISVVFQGRLRADRVSEAVTAKKDDLAKQGLYLI